MVVFRSMSLVITPPAVSRPMDSGVTSRRSRSCTCEEPSPVRMAAWTAAPNATASSGLMDLQGSLPLKNSWIIDCTFGAATEGHNQRDNIALSASNRFKRLQRALAA
eukprot:8791932-Alexandrium_andersonii.AAC.1